MRVLFVTFPWHTHFQFCAPMAWALRTAGHEVHFAGSPDLIDVITGAGHTAVPVGPDEPFTERAYRARENVQGKLKESGVINDTSGDTSGGSGGGSGSDSGSGNAPVLDLGENGEENLPWSYLKLIAAGSTEVAKLANDAMIDDLVAYCRWWKPDLVVWEWLTYAGAVAAAAVGAAHARMPIGIEVEARIRRHFVKVRDQQPPADREDPMRDWLGGWGDKYGFEFSEDLVTGQFTIDQVPDSMRLACEVPHVPVRYVPYNGPAVVPEWIRGEPRAPRVLATFGTSMWDTDKSGLVLDSQRVSKDQLQDMLDSLADLDIELVMTLPVSMQKQLEHIPDNARFVEFVPMHTIVPSCAAVIHHGGLPTFLSSLAHGIPQIMLTWMAPDASVRGARLHKAGAGEWIPPERMTGRRIRDTLVRLLDDPSGAQRLRDEVRAQLSPNDAAPELERLAARFGSR
ncbi:activator-dependent family glycosyltransferase [Streptomyces sp. NBS 14/10]|uniref:activator-dependent family glycosyltransferase n=1 Tax=Streptomyces sp. NBS 14/10 TaxID=1945643 RepID=UPI000D19C216|nr:activator-dependent family glycosyltransferase [Streptomyces sp. NBS 14/10]KAK1178070.1 activator-dependent family glycosyltransferase [Streptomyces sp. NBS 14/10]